MATSPSTVDGAARSGPTAPAPAAGTLRLAVGVVALEFAAAVQPFVGASLLPAIAADLHASVQLGLLLAGSTIGMFVALPLAPRLLPRLGYRRGLAIALPLSLGGLALASAAVTPWMFALDRLTGGLAGQATGGGIVSTALAAGAGDRAGFAVAYGLFAACLTAAGYAVSRAGE